MQLFTFSPAQARNAYSAVLLLPEVATGVRFHPLLQPYKRLWSAHVPKYGAFWDPWPLLLHLAQTPIVDLEQDTALLRLQLILVLRLLCLFRSHDLAQMKRTASILGAVPYIKVRRKGQKRCQWERVVSLPDYPQISPFHLLQTYVRVTRGQIKPGGRYFWR